MPPDTLTPFGAPVVLTVTVPVKPFANVTVTVPVVLLPTSTTPRLPPPETVKGAWSVPVALNVTSWATGPEIARPASAANTPGTAAAVMGIETAWPESDAVAAARTWKVTEETPAEAIPGFGVTLMIPAGKVPTRRETPPVKFGFRSMRTTNGLVFPRKNVAGSELRENPSDNSTACSNLAVRPPGAVPVTVTVPKPAGAPLVVLKVNVTVPFPPGTAASVGVTVMPLLATTLNCTLSVKPDAGVTVTGKLAVPARNRGSEMGAVVDNENDPAVTVKFTVLDAVPEAPRTLHVAGPVAVAVAETATWKLV